MSEPHIHAGTPASRPERQSREPPSTWLPTHNLPTFWCRIARAFNEAANAWSAELRGTVSDRPYQNVRDFAAWKRLREGRPTSLDRYERERETALRTPSGRASVLAPKLRLYAEQFGMLDPLHVSRFRSGLPRSATNAEQLLGAILEDAYLAADHERDLQAKLRKARATAKKLRAELAKVR